MEKLKQKIIKKINIKIKLFRLKLKLNELNFLYNLIFKDKYYNN